MADGMVETTEAIEEAVPSTETDRRATDRRAIDDRRAGPREGEDRRRGDRRAGGSAQEQAPFAPSEVEGSSRAKPRGSGREGLGSARQGVSTSLDTNGSGGRPSDPGAAVGFNPQPDPPVTAAGAGGRPEDPGAIAGFNPQPDPPVTLASPAVRARARDLGIDLAQVKTASERVRHADLDAYLLYSGGTVSRGGPRRQDETVKVIGLRRRIAENMAEAKRRIPHFTLVEEYDVTALEQTRSMMNADRGGNPKLTLLPFLITAMCRTLAGYPQINATYDDEAQTIARSGAVHMGMATQTPNGLMVPVIRNADSLSVWDIAGEILRLSEAARTGKASREELSGSTITISSLGPMGGIASTPVINRPEVAILAVNKVEEKAVVVDGELEIRKRMNLSLSCDHRVVDGWDAASFLQDLKAMIENPLKLLSMH
jgi:2-oxoisovalerate dehydrogenase E2 component (dihydrolipoyl transacylase)